MINIHTTFVFKGNVDTKSDLPESASLGDVWHVKTTDSDYVYTGTGWTCMSIGIIGTSGTYNTQLSSTHPISDPVAQICTQCNGTLELDTFGRLHCPYCGTIYK